MYFLKQLGREIPFINSFTNVHFPQWNSFFRDLEVPLGVFGGFGFPSWCRSLQLLLTWAKSGHSRGPRPFLFRGSEDATEGVLLEKMTCALAPGAGVTLCGPALAGGKSDTVFSLSMECSVFIKLCQMMQHTNFNISLAAQCQKDGTMGKGIRIEPCPGPLQLLGCFPC